MAAYFSEWNCVTCGSLEGSMQGSVFFHVFIHNLQKAGINKVTKFTNDYLPMTMQCTKGSHKEMKKNVTTQKSLKPLRQSEF